MQAIYDKSDPKSIETYGKRLLGNTLRTVSGAFEIPDSLLSLKPGKNSKASFGALIENYYYGIRPDNASGEPDFPVAEVELKTTPIKITQHGKYSAKERLVLGMINYLEEARKDFLTSSFFKKNHRLMLISYLHDSGHSVGDFPVKIAKIVEFEGLPDEDKKIIREDWQKIKTKISAGVAHELSEGDTLYLGACTKAPDSSKFRAQVGGVPAKPRAYSFKSGYMTMLLRRELGEIALEERAVKEYEAAQPLTFEEVVLKKFDLFVGKTVEQIHNIVGEGLEKDSKDYLAVLARRMLGVKGKRILEFDAAEVSMKTIQLKANGSPKESMSFPAIDYDQLVRENWDGDEDAGEVKAAFQMQIEKRFLFIVYECDGDCKNGDRKIFKKAMFWTMPFLDREEARWVWGETVKRVKAGRFDDLPGSTENRVAHVRPHAQNAEDTTTFDGIDVKKKSFWLNQSYLKNVVG